MKKQKKIDDGVKISERVKYFDVTKKKTMVKRVSSTKGAFTCVKALSTTKHQMRFFVCHQMRSYVCIQMCLYGVSPNAFT